MGIILQHFPPFPFLMLCFVIGDKEACSVFNSRLNCLFAEIPPSLCATSAAWSGNKSVAVEVLQAFLGLEPHQCLHVGDQVSDC